MPTSLPSAVAALALLTAVGSAAPALAAPAPPPPPAAAAPAAAPHWYHELEPALADAARTDRFLLVDLFAEWCGWCHRLDREVFSSPAFASAARDFVLLRVDVEDGATGSWLQDRLAARSLPTLAILDADLVQVGKVLGYHPTPLFLASIDQAVELYRARLAADEEQAASGDPAAMRLAARRFLARQDGRRAAAVLERLRGRDDVSPAERVELDVWRADAHRVARDYDAAADALAAARGELAAAPADEVRRLQESVDVSTLRLADARRDCQSVTALERFLQERGSSPHAATARSALAGLRADPALHCS